MSKRIAIIGTGANGSCIAADLIEAGYDITMIDAWPDHINTMRESGLHVVHPDRDLHVAVNALHICEVCKISDKFDYIFLCFKAYDTCWAARLMVPYLAQDGLFLGVQNGLTADVIANIVGPNRTLGCVVELASEMFEPGKIKRSTPRSGTWFGVGALDPSMEGRIDEIVQLLSHVGKVSKSENVRSGKWMKLIVNAMSMCPNAMIGRNGNVSVTIPGMRDLMLRCGEEALAVGQQAGYQIEPVFGLTKDDITGSNQLLEMLLEKILNDVGPSARNTVFQDHLKGRRSECALMNGWVVEEAAKSGLNAHANAAIVEITRQIEAGEIKPDPSNLELALLAESEINAGRKTTI